MMRKFLVIGLIMVSLNACADLTEDTSRAKVAMKMGDYIGAINMLHQNKGRPSKEILSDAYIGYGIQVLRNLKIEKSLRYDMARENYEKALQANPKNPKAKDFYQMIIKVQAQEAAK